MSDNKKLLYINGQFLDSTTGEYITVINPANEEIVGNVPKAGKAEADAAVQAARFAFDSGVWSDLAPEKRAEKLVRMGELLTERMDMFNELLMKETGCIIGKAMVETGMTIQLFNYYAKMISSPIRYDHKEMDPYEHATYSYSFINREPIGVVTCIAPFNFPFILATMKIVPALAAGNTVVVKPSSETPLATMELARIAHDAGVPAGVFNTITGPGSVIGEILASHPLVDKVALTGSTETGRKILEYAASTIKLTTLELGGKSANIILDDAELDAAIDGSLQTWLFHSGQVCHSGQRLLVAKSIYEEVLKRLVERASHVQIGDPRDPATLVGPVISRKQKESIERYIKIGIEEGARVAFGGKPLEGGIFDKGFWVHPTIFADVNNSMTIAQEEIFGPVLSVIPFEDDEEAIRIANDSIYGLGGGVWSQNIKRAVSVAKRIRTGNVWINNYATQGCDSVFGGVKQSGLGKELGMEGLLAYTQAKFIHVDLECDHGARYGWMFTK